MEIRFMEIRRMEGRCMADHGMGDRCMDDRFAEDRYVKPHFESAAVVTIDLQNDFSLPGAVAEIPGTAGVLPNAARIAEAARQAGMPIIHVIRIYREDGSNADACRRRLLESGRRIVAPGTPGADLVAAIKPADAEPLMHDRLLGGEIQSLGPREWVIYKPRWGAFYGTALDAFLRDRGVDTLIVVGCNFPNCPRTTIYEASERDYRVVMVEDAVSGVYGRGVEELRNIGVRVMSTDEVLERIAATGRKDGSAAR